VFDETDRIPVDAVRGRSLWALARRHQVLCVTHLPQIAAHADAHYRIAKHERDGRTVTEIERLDREGRIVELAQMLGGEAGGATSLAGARELLDRAEAWRLPGRPGGLRPAADDRAADRDRRYLTYLHVERGCCRPRSRLPGRPRDFAGARGVRRLVVLAGGRHDYLPPDRRAGARPGSRAEQPRRRAAALKGFYRFAYGEGLIRSTSPPTFDLPRPRLCPRR
jgi:hypothetical protein